MVTRLRNRSAMAFALLQHLSLAHFLRRVAWQNIIRFCFVTVVRFEKQQCPEPGSRSQQGGVARHRGAKRRRAPG